MRERKRKMRILLSSLALLASVSTFRVAQVEPRVVKVKEGETFRVVCTTDTWYEFCTIKHDDKICDIVWKWDAWNVTMGQCDHFSDRAVFAVSFLLTSIDSLWHRSFLCMEANYAIKNQRVASKKKRRIFWHSKDPNTYMKL